MHIGISTAVFVDLNIRCYAHRTGGVVTMIDESVNSSSSSSGLGDQRSGTAGKALKGLAVPSSSSSTTAAPKSSKGKSPKK
jgi:hypothetical protein